jgi:hypothetical protein
MARLGHARPVRPQILRGWVEFEAEAGDANAPAGVASATGDAPQPEVTIAPNAGLAAGTGDAPQATAHVRALAGVATAVGEAPQPTVQTTTEAAPPRPIVATATAIQTAAQRYRRQPVPVLDFGAPLAQPETQAPAGQATAGGKPLVALEYRTPHNATTPDHASFAITDLDIEVTLGLQNWAPGVGNPFIVAGQSAIIADIGPTLTISVDGKLSIGWSTDGTLGTSNSVTTTAAPGLAAGSEHTIRATLDVDNGAAGKTWQFFVDGTLFETASPGGTTSIFNSTQPLTVGVFAGADWQGYIRSAKLRASIGGTEVANPDFSIQTVGDTSFDDAVGRTWIVTGLIRPNVGKAAVAALPNTPVAAGTALQPTVDTGGAVVAPTRPVVATDTAVKAAISARRRQATAQFVDLGAPIIVEDVNAPAGLASATGVANAAKADIDVKSNTPEAAGTAPQPTVQTGTFTNAPAGLAAGIGTAFAASVTIRPNAGVGLAAGVASQPEAEIGAKPGFGLAAGTAPQPTVAFGALAQAGLASASGTANQPKAHIRVLVGAAAATGEAFGVFGLVGNPLGDPQGIIAVDDDHSLTARDHPVGLIAVDDDHSL